MQFKIKDASHLLQVFPSVTALQGANKKERGKKAGLGVTGSGGGSNPRRGALQDRGRPLYPCGWAGSVCNNRQLASGNRAAEWYLGEPRPAGGLGRGAQWGRPKHGGGPPCRSPILLRRAGICSASGSVHCGGALPLPQTRKWSSGGVTSEQVPWDFWTAVYASAFFFFLYLSSA